MMGNRIIIVGFLLISLFLQTNESARASERQITFPKRIECTLLPGEVTRSDGASFPAREKSKLVRLYTRLGKINEWRVLPPASEELQVWGDYATSPYAYHDLPREDELAYSYNGEYYGAFINQERYRYSLWTCDSWDIEFSFDTEELVADREVAPRFKLVKAKVTESVREYSNTSTVNCKAFY